MKDILRLSLIALFALACDAGEAVEEGDPLESAAYEESVLSQVPEEDSKFDMWGSGATATLGLPDQASCPQLVDGTDVNAARDASETDSTDGSEEDDSSDGTGAADGTDIADATDETEPADNRGDAADDRDPADNMADGTDEGDPADPAGGNRPEAETGEPPAMTDPCAEAVADTPWKQVYDLERGQVRFPDDLQAPEQYPRPSVDDVGLGGTEFWQKWSGGENPTFNYYKGSDYGRRCMAAAALRFQLIMVEPPEAILDLKANTNWNGRFFNWVDDYGGPNPWGSASGAKLWAWRTGLIKWISQAAEDGTCYLPTYSQVEGLADNCLARGAGNGGEIQGCRD